MIKNYIAFLKTSGLSPYVWAILCILPFYFILQSDASNQYKMTGIVVTLLFLSLFRVAYKTTGWMKYVWAIVLMSGFTVMTILFGYIYFAFFLAYLAGNIKKKADFIAIYVLLLISTGVSIYLGILLHQAFFLKQMPFIIITWLSITLLPFTIRNRKVLGRLEEKLDDANKKISELLVVEERERIARDLHDTLGQKLSLIGLKSDLARRLVYKNPEQAAAELVDVQQTARTALNEVRKMVSSMRSIRLKDEIVLAETMLNAANIHFSIDERQKLKDIPSLTENILSMCLKESVTNIVKHSGATECQVIFEQDWKETVMTVRDNGVFKGYESSLDRGHGLMGMKERLEFVNGSFEIALNEGTCLIIKVPNETKQVVKEGRA
ncbi:sensor histidine kinase [Gracilibacillus sp. Marseille-QA3620]